MQRTSPTEENSQKQARKINATKWEKAKKGTKQKIKKLDNKKSKVEY
jgi:hypothetical protein